MSSPRNSLCSLSGSCSLAITYSSCTFSLSSELSSSIVEGGSGWVVGLSNKVKFVSVTCVEEMSSLIGLTDRPWASSCCCPDTVQNSPIRSGRAWQWLPCCQCPI